MISKKVLGLALCVSIMGGTSIAIYNNEAKAEEIKILDYKEAIMLMKEDIKLINMKM